MALVSRSASLVNCSGAPGGTGEPVSRTGEARMARGRKKRAVERVNFILREKIGGFDDFLLAVKGSGS
jgi:hypothetical protein